MRTVNVRELKARLSAYLRDVRRGETFFVTDRGQVVARLAPLSGDDARLPPVVARLAALGARPPLRERQATDYARPGRGAGLSTAAIDALLDDARGDR